MTKRSPYSFPHRSRKAMIAYLAEHESYCPMNTWNGGHVLAWNVKVYNCDSAGHAALWRRVYKISASKSDFKNNPARDDAWREHVENNPDLFWHCAEDASRMYLEGEWTNYPGIEQGEWKFERNGRSGGYFILSDAPGWVPAPLHWRCNRMAWESRASYKDWLAGLDTKTLRRFYRAIRVLDRDLRREAVEAEMSYQFAFQRQQWEEEQNSEEECEARKQEEARPDLYQGGCLGSGGGARNAPMRLLTR